MTPIQLQHFLSLAQTTSMNRAAATLFITQQALSKSISNLEDELGTALFDRSPKGCYLTPVGRKIYPIVQIMLKDFDDRTNMILSIAGNRGTALRLGFEHILMQYVLPVDFTSRIGNTQIITWVADSYSALEDALRKDLCDVGMIHRPEKRLPKDLSYIPVAADKPMILMNRSFYLAKKKEVTLEDLRFVPMIIPSVNANIIDQFFRKCVVNGFYPKVVSDTNELGIILRMVEENAGAAFVAGYAVEPSIKNDSVVMRRLNCDGLVFEVGFLKKKQTESKALDSFISAVKSLFN